jgi:hypothetical protein
MSARFSWDLPADDAGAVSSYRTTAGPGSCMTSSSRARPGGSQLPRLTGAKKLIRLGHVIDDQCHFGRHFVRSFSAVLDVEYSHEFDAIVISQR